MDEKRQREEALAENFDWVEIFDAGLKF